MGNYSAQNGYGYQYYLDSHQRSDQNSEYIFVVNRDGQRVFPVLVLVCGDALAAWADRQGHALSDTAAYAAANCASSVPSMK